MAGGEFGQLGQALRFLPLGSVIMLLTVYCAATSFVEELRGLFSVAPKWVYAPFNCGHIRLGPVPMSSAELDKFPDVIFRKPLPFLGSVLSIQAKLRAIFAVWAALTLICPRGWKAQLLAGSVAFDIFCQFLAIGCCLYGFNQKMFLEFDPEYLANRPTKEAFFGISEWPATFWINLATKASMEIMMSYYVLNICYSYYNVVSVGGTGWELTPAENLPGWKRYLAEKQAKEEARRPRPPHEQGGPGGEINPADLEALMNMLGGGGGGAMDPQQLAMLLGGPLSASPPGQGVPPGMVAPQAPQDPKAQAPASRPGYESSPSIVG